MKPSLIGAAVVFGLAISTAAMAQTPAASSPSPERYDVITMASGGRVGRVEYVDKARDGTPTGVAVIRDTRMVHIPISTISPGPKGFVTSLTRADLDKLP